MKKYGLQTILILAFGFLAHQFFGFWAIVVVAGLIGFVFRHENSVVSFAAGMTGAALLWGGYAGFVNSANTNILCGKMGALFQMDGAYLTYLTGLVGGILGGMGALTGSLARKVFLN